MTNLKSPLRFPGGKSRLAKLIMAHFPPGIDTLISPFMGGGGVELRAAQQGIRVIAYDGFKPLAAFWERLLDSDDIWDLIGEIQSFFPLSAKQFRKTQENFDDEFTFCSAVKFFVLNRASFSGTTMSGGCTKTPSEGENARFTQSSIDRLKEFVNVSWTDKLSVQFSLWPDTLAQHPSEFMYLDPPYMIGPKIYGVRGDMHRGFDHQGLATTLRARTAPFLLSYNDCEEVRALYEGCTIEAAEWLNSMSSKKKRQQELFIRNY
jgi:DNA adenine methylase